MKARIPYTRPSITQLEQAYAADAVATGWGEKCYDYINRFEKDFRNHLGVDFAIATSSCTGALHMGLAALSVGPEDEVILADTNWIATVAPIIHLGAKPVFVDILKDTWCLDPDKVECAISSKTKAIIATHIYGNLCDMDRLLAIGARHGIPVVEDSAEAMGSIWKQKRAGSMGAFGAFSFHGTKTLTTGEGGMFVTSDAALYERVLTLSNHGRARGQSKQFWADIVGYKYKMSNVQAAIGCAQLERIEELVAKKRKILNYYCEHLAGHQGISLNPEPNGTVNGAWMPTVVFAKELNISREHLMAAFKSENIDARVFFWPLSSLPSFEPVKTNKVAWDIPERAINLPSFHDISEEELDRVIGVIERVYKFR